MELEFTEDDIKSLYFKAMQQVNVHHDGTEPGNQHHTDTELEKFVDDSGIRIISEIPLNELEKTGPVFSNYSELMSNLKGVMENIETELGMRLFVHDRLLKGHIGLIGSSKDGTKIGHLDEFDALYISHIPDKWEAKQCEKDTFYTITDHNGKEVKPSNVFTKLADTIDDVCSTITLPEKLKFGGFASEAYSGCRVNGPAATVLFITNETNDPIALSYDITFSFMLKDPQISSKIDKQLEIIQNQIETKPVPKGKVHLVPNIIRDKWLISTAGVEAKILSELDDKAPAKQATKVAKAIGKCINDCNGKMISASKLVPVSGVTEYLYKELRTYKEGTSEYQNKTLSSLRRKLRYGHIYISYDKALEYGELPKNSISINNACLKHSILGWALQMNNAFTIQENDKITRKLVIAAYKDVYNKKKRSVPHALLSNVQINRLSFSVITAEKKDLTSLEVILKRHCKCFVEHWRKPEASAVDGMPIGQKRKTPPGIQPIHKQDKRRKLTNVRSISNKAATSADKNKAATSADKDGIHRLKRTIDADDQGDRSSDSCDSDDMDRPGATTEASVGVLCDEEGSSTEHMDDRSSNDTDGEDTDDERSTDGDDDDENTSDGNTTDGNTTDENTTDGNTTDENTTDGNTIDENTTKGNTKDGNTKDGNTIDDKISDKADSTDAESLSSALKQLGTPENTKFTFSATVTEKWNNGAKDKEGFYFFVKVTDRYSSAIIKVYYRGIKKDKDRLNLIKCNQKWRFINLFRNEKTSADHENFYFVCRRTSDVRKTRQETTSPQHAGTSKDEHGAWRTLNQALTTDKTSDIIGQILQVSPLRHLKKGLHRYYLLIDAEMQPVIMTIFQKTLKDSKYKTGQVIKGIVKRRESIVGNNLYTLTPRGNLQIVGTKDIPPSMKSLPSVDRSILQQFDEYFSEEGALTKFKIPDIENVGTYRCCTSKGCNKKGLEDDQCPICDKRYRSGQSPGSAFYANVSVQHAGKENDCTIFIQHIKSALNESIPVGISPDELEDKMTDRLPFTGLASIIKDKREEGKFLFEIYSISGTE